MRKLLGWILFVLGIIVLGWWGRGHEAVDMQSMVRGYADNLSADINGRFSDTNVSATVSGRDIDVSGTTTEADVEAILDEYRALDGRRVVRNNLTAQNIMSPFTLDATYNGAEPAMLKGYAGDVDAVDAIKGALAIDDAQIDVATGAPEGWQAAATTSLGALSKLKNGVLSMSDQDIMIKGDADDIATYDAVMADLDALPAGYKLAAEITTPEPEPEPEPVVEAPAPTVDSCGDLTTAILSNAKINFVTASAEIDAASGNVIDELAEVLKPCLLDGGLSVEVGGHTDADGAEEYNLNLSQERAGAVVQALVDRGVPADRMNAKGYGETQPIASNDTDEGKAQNRRTTITWIDN